MKLAIERKQNIAMIMFWYWIIIIAWQFVRPVANRSLIDTAVKMGVLCVVIWYSFNRSNWVVKRDFGICLVVFIASQSITLGFDSRSLSRASLITVLFMFIQIFVFLIMLEKETITENVLQTFCKAILYTSLIMALYSVLFDFSTFRLIFSSSGSAYGSECNSFLYSNHEYGIYLSAGILSCIWLLIRKLLKPLAGIFFLPFLFANLLSTYSRTAILGCVAAVFVLLFFYKKATFTVTLSLLIVFLVFVYSYEPLYELLFEKILKGTFVEGQIMDENRSSMYLEQFRHFLNGNLKEKFFGYGYEGRNRFSGHDAYLGILLTGGIFMFIFFIAVIIWGISFSLKTLRCNKSIGSLLLSYQVFSLLYMLAQTPILFYSTMDSFFITMITILIPKYVYNYFKENEGELVENSTDQLRVR